jgi:hypothetical protein
MSGISMTTELRIKVGVNEIVVQKAQTGGLISVKSANGNKLAMGKPVEGLQLVRKGQKAKDVISISDDAVIVTHSSPDCITYIYNGQEYEICF